MHLFTKMSNFLHEIRIQKYKVSNASLTILQNWTSRWKDLQTAEKKQKPPPFGLCLIFWAESIWVYIGQISIILWVDLYDFVGLHGFISTILLAYILLLERERVSIHGSKNIFTRWDASIVHMLRTRA